LTVKFFEVENTVKKISLILIYRMFRHFKNMYLIKISKKTVLIHNGHFQFKKNLIFEILSSNNKNCLQPMSLSLILVGKVVEVCLVELKISKSSKGIPRLEN